MNINIMSIIIHYMMYFCIQTCHDEGSEPEKGLQSDLLDALHCSEQSVSRHMLSTVDCT